MRILLTILPALILSTIAAWTSYIAAGPTLGLFLAAPIFIALLLPPLCASAQTLADRLLILAAALFPFFAVLHYATLRTETYWRELFACSAILTAWAIALTGVVAGLRLIRLGPIPAAALCVALALAALTWPIWMSPTWNGSASAESVARGLAIHPGITINAQLARHLGVWTEQSVAYHLTDLSQNVPFTLPATLWPVLLFHLLLGGALLAIAEVRRRRMPPASGPDAQR